ncbi:prepilin-type N-terminal cleavage/methylation domain-containing protein [bacterium]|nr:prepilin-type N-terminal cleavage/methylation domain-containing protein [bacterium]
MNKQFATRRPRAAFTLIEVILAVTIFGLTMIAITTVMRTGVRSWAIGHALSELMQNVRVSQDVIVRDLNNICYRRETEYNQTFRNQIERLGTEIISQTAIDPRDPYKNFNPRMIEKFLPSQRNRRGRSRDGENENQIFLDEITPPIDLSLRGTDSGTNDRISFVRRQNPDWSQPESTWGLRRITYYVKDKVLYREEGDPFGFRPGAGISNFIFTLDPTFNPMDMFNSGTNRNYATGNQSPLSQLTQFFTPPVEASDKGEDSRGQFLPPSIHYTEPVCQGVETFNISYGYFLEGQWVEVNTWDSNSMQYRSTLDRDFFGQMDQNAINNFFRSPMNPYDAIRYRADTNFNVSPASMMNPSMQQPDELPGYVAIQIGIRSPELKGKLYTFTIFHSMPLAEETDMKFDEDSMMTANSDPRYRDLGTRRYSRRDSNKTGRFEHSTRSRNYSRRH